MIRTCDTRDSRCETEREREREREPLMRAESRGPVSQSSSIYPVSQSSSIYPAPSSDELRPGADHLLRTLGPPVATVQLYSAVYNCTVVTPATSLHPQTVSLSATLGASRR